MRTTKVLCALALLVALPGLGLAAGDGFGELSVDEVAKRGSDKNFYVFDCNPREEYDEGHLPKAKWVDFSTVSANDLPKDKNATLVFYCQNEH